MECRRWWSHELVGPWEHFILQCIPTCHGILGIPDPEMCTYGILGTLGCGTLTRAPLGYFYNAPPLGGGGLFRAPPSDLRNYWADSKNSNGIWKTWKNCREKTNFIDRGVTSDVTGQVKVKMFDISGFGDIGEQNCDVKHKQSQLIGMDSVTDICKYHYLCFVTIIKVKVISGHQVKKVKQKNFVI